MARFKLSRTLYQLTFEGDLAGLEITAGRTSVEGLLELAELAEEMERLGGHANTAQGLRESLGKALVPFVKLLKSWNLDDDDDQPVPLTVAGLLSQEMDVLAAIINGYVNAMTQAPPPLPGGSGAGGQTPEESLSLASASVPLPSSPGPT